MATAATHVLAEMEAKASRGDALTRAEAERVLATTDLVSVGVTAEAARRRRSGDAVTFGRVRVIDGGAAAAPGNAGEVRLQGQPASIDEAVAWTTAAARLAGGVPLTGFSLATLVDLTGGDRAALRAAAADLRSAGLEAVAEVALDRIASIAELVTAVEALTGSGLGVWRATIDHAPAADRLDLILRAADLQAATGALRAFAPLPRRDPAAVPSTGYDDVRTVAAAVLVCTAIPFIQVDWPLYGPKLAQVAIAFGANDIDGIAADDDMSIGPRRTPVEEIARQIRAAAATPVERDGRYGRRS